MCDMHRRVRAWIASPHDCLSNAERPLVVAAAIATAIYFLVFPGPCLGLEPPTREQIEKYRNDGVLKDRIDDALRIGNHRLAPHLVERLKRINEGPEIFKSADPYHGLPSLGTHRVFALLIAFSDHPPDVAASVMHDRLFGDGDPGSFPLDSMRNYYLRSSYGQLDIQGDTLGWYTTTYPRSAVEKTNAGRDRLIQEAIDHFDAAGHDFSQYDNNGNGEIDYFLVFFAGPTDYWAGFWWGQYSSVSDYNYEVDGVTLYARSWQPSSASPYTAIHETGHALGLPDYYDYNSTVGPDGGIGVYDVMHSADVDHNSFSKFLLGWVTPQVHNEGSHTVELDSSASSTDVALLMHGEPPSDPLAEYFLVQNRHREGNDINMPGDGLLIWHVDARADIYGNLLSDNSYTEHKLLRLMEADGLEEIETGDGLMDEGDYYTQGDDFGSHTFPSSDRYDGSPTNLWVFSVSQASETMSFRIDMGSGCGLFCEAQGGGAIWVGSAATMEADPGPSNCPGITEFSWDFGDGKNSTTDQEVVFHPYAEEGIFTWHVDMSQMDATCSRSGSILACRDDRCWKWWTESSTHPEPWGSNYWGYSASSTPLADDRILAFGGYMERDAQIYDPVSQSWEKAADSNETHWFPTMTLLDDGRVLLIGGSFYADIGTEIYDPTQNTWAFTTPIDAGRTDHAAAKLKDGRVLVVGGIRQIVDVWSTPLTVEAEIFDPTDDSWRATTAPPVHFKWPSAVTLDDGQVLVVGYYNLSFFFDPKTETWRLGSPLIQNRDGQCSAVKLADGRVLVFGGMYDESTEVYDPSTGAWSAVGPMNFHRRYTEGTLLKSGKVLVAGGMSKFLNETWATAEVFDPTSGTWSLAESMKAERCRHAASPLPDGGVLVVGGHYYSDPYNPFFVERYGLDEIYFDGFESGDTTAWSDTIP